MHGVQANGVTGAWVVEVVVEFDLEARWAAVVGLEECE
jgi:hypothetical protein